VAATTTARPVARPLDFGALLGYLLISPPVLLMLLLIFYPATQSVVRTLFAPGADGAARFSLESYTSFFSNRILMWNLWFTIWVTLVTVIGLFLLCVPLALYLRFATGWIAAAVQVLALFPLFVPGIILSFALIRFLGPRGTLETLLNAVGIGGYVTPYLKPSGIIIALIWEGIPFTVLILTAGLRQIEDPLIESARDVGAGGWQILTRILLPLTQRSVLIAFCLNFIGIFGSYTIPYLLGPAAPQMMGVSMQQTYSEYQDRLGAETQAVITFLCCAVIGFLYVRAVTRQRAGEGR
jgi:putative spermidine/putrescine transport system permease protein